MIRREQVFIILSSVGYRKVYIFHFQKSCFFEGFLFYSKNEVATFSKIEL